MSIIDISKVERGEYAISDICKEVELGNICYMNWKPPHDFYDRYSVEKIWRDSLPFWVVRLREVKERRRNSYGL